MTTHVLPEYYESQQKTKTAKSALGEPNRHARLIQSREAHEALKYIFVISVTCLVLFLLLPNSGSRKDQQPGTSLCLHNFSGDFLSISLPGEELIVRSFLFKKEIVLILTKLKLRCTAV